jgi:putative flippase GtrA
MSATLFRPFLAQRGPRVHPPHSPDFVSCYGRRLGRFALRNLIGQMFRFGLVGLVNAGVDAAVFFTAVAILTHVATVAIHPDWILILSNACSWIVAVTCSYVLNSRFTFARHSGGKMSLHGYLLFAASQIGGFIAHTAVLVTAAKYFPLPIAKLLGIGVGFVVNFTLARTIVFRNA